MDFRPHVLSHLASLKLAHQVEIVEELAQHLEDVYQESIESGLSHSEGVARAIGVLPATAGELARAVQAASSAPAARIGDSLRAALDEPSPSPARKSILNGLGRDCRYALRGLTREPGFTIAVVITLALGIGATSTVFSAVDAVLLKSPAVAEPGRVVSVFSVWAARATANPDRGDQLGMTSYPDYVDMRDSGALQGLAAFSAVGLAFESYGVTEQIDAAIVSGNYFDVLGVRPSIGRTFAQGEDRVAFPVRVVVLSHSMWQQRLGGDPAIVGRSITLNGGAYTVIGVAPRGFVGIELSDVPEAWVPMATQEEVRPASTALRQRLGTRRTLGARDTRWLSLAGRLNAGSTVSGAAAALDTIGRNLQASFPESNRDIGFTAVPLGEGPGARARARPSLAFLTVAVILVLAIACANVASLLLARAFSRRREVAVRIAIGAGQGHLVRQWLTEALILGVLGAVGGVLLTGWSAPILQGFGLPQGLDLSINYRILIFALAVGLVTGMVVGLAPIVETMRPEIIATLRTAPDTFGRVRTARLRSAFVVLQFALSLVLLLGAGLLARTLQQAYGVDLGYHIDHVLVADLNAGGSSSAETSQELYARLLERVNVIPGVASASLARVQVLSGTTRTMPVSLDRQPPRADRSNVIPVRANVVSNGYFETMGIPILLGRGFDPTDDRGAPRVAVITRSLADRLWPNGDPIGQTFLSMMQLEVVGVVPDTVYVSATERDPRPIFYVPLAQNPESALALHVRTTGDPLAIVPIVRGAVREVDPRLVLTRPRTLSHELDRSMAGQRAMATLSTVLSAVALVLAAVGLYGALSYATKQRTAEVGLRLALGATPASLMSLIVSSGLRLVLIGGTIGFAGAYAGARYLRTLLFGVEPTDPLTWLAVSSVLMTVALAACAIPARRAMRIDPAITLKSY
jgi:putative ABC transport system permease protein